MTKHWQSIIRYGWLILFLLLFMKGGASPSRMVLLDSGWKFGKGSMDGAQLNDFDDSGWELICLPYDWSAGKIRNLGDDENDPFSKENAGAGATGYTVGGEGWYRKKFITDNAEKIYSILFEGVYMETEVWVNGVEVARHTNGYTPFLCDITTYCRPPGEENCLAVRVLNTGKNSRWYSGSGIYRHVWLVSTAKVHFEQWGTFVSTTEVSSGLAELKLSSAVINRSGEKCNTSVVIDIFSPEGEKVATATGYLDTEAGATQQISRSIRISDPQLWSVGSPALYHAHLSLFSEDNKKDEIDIRFGIRSIAFTVENGFLLNGMPLKLKGGCIHHDNGLLGAAAIDRAEVRKAELLKANGFNAVRCAHNPPSTAFLDACDELGLLVIDEAFDQWEEGKNPDDYHRFFDQYHEQDLRSMILHGRNHPSVIMWSIGNEIPERADPSGAETARRLVSVIHRYDTTRPVTAAVNNFWDHPEKTWADSETAFSPLDVAGYNYMWQEYENDHMKFPRRVMFGSESVALEAAKNWDLVIRHPYIIGDFVWTALDYLGEAGIGHSLMLEKDEDNPMFMGWPWFNAWCGDIDICGDKKPQSFYRDVIWGERPVTIGVHVPVSSDSIEKVSYWGWPGELQCWNWKGHEGEPMNVNVYSKPGEVTLYLNGEMLGQKKITTADNYTASFVVPYQAGVLKAVREGAGNEPFILKTTDVPSAIRLVADRSKIEASPNDLAYIKIEATDASGLIVPDADLQVKLTVSGEGILAGAGNACPTDMQSFRSLSPKLFRGKALAIVRPNGTSGKIRLTVTAGNLPETSVTITTK